MPLYTVRLEKYHVFTTRSRHEDTNFVTLGLRVGDTMFDLQTRGPEDVDDGEHPIGLSIGPVFVADDATPISFAYQIYNGSSNQREDILVKLRQTSDALTTKSVAGVRSEPFTTIDGGGIDDGVGGAPPSTDDSDDVDGPGTSSKNRTADLDETLAMIMLVGAIAALLKFLITECDGFVAMAFVGKRKLDWDRLLDDNAGTFGEEDQQVGTKSPEGCGRDSSYSVTWSLAREALVIGEPFPVGAFLRAHGVDFSAGLRSLNPSVGSFSLRRMLGIVP